MENRSLLFPAPKFRTDIALFPPPPFKLGQKPRGHRSTGTGTKVYVSCFLVRAYEVLVQCFWCGTASIGCFDSHKHSECASEYTNKGHPAKKSWSTQISKPHERGKDLEIFGFGDVAEDELAD
jgi:hypothetical protein